MFTTDVARSSGSEVYVRPLDAIRLSIPFTEISSRQDWAKLISEVQGLDRRLLQVKECGFGIVKDFDTMCTREKLSWLAIWVRVFGCVEAADRLRTCPNSLALGVLSRIAFEAQLQAMLLQEPIDPLTTSQSLPRLDDSVWHAVSHRLRGYLAWLISHDLFRTECALRPEVLQDVSSSTINESPRSTPDTVRVSYVTPKGQ